MQNDDVQVGLTIRCLWARIRSNLVNFFFDLILCLKGLQNELIVSFELHDSDLLFAYQDDPVIDLNAAVSKDRLIELNCRSLFC